MTLTSTIAGLEGSTVEVGEDGVAGTLVAPEVGVGGVEVDAGAGVDTVVAVAVAGAAPPPPQAVNASTNAKRIRNGSLDLIFI